MQLQSVHRHTSGLLRPQCPTLHAKRADSHLLARSCLELIGANSVKWAPRASVMCLRSSSTKMPLRRRDCLSTAGELEAAFYISTGMKDYKMMIEYWGSATSEYPFSLQSGVPPLIIKLFSWKSSLFLNYLGRWSGKWIFCGGQSFLKAKKKEKGNSWKRA